MILACISMILTLYSIGSGISTSQDIGDCVSGKPMIYANIEFTCQLTEKQVKLNQLEEEKRKLLGE